MVKTIKICPECGKQFTDFDKSNKIFCTKCGKKRLYESHLTYQQNNYYKNYEKRRMKNNA